MKNLTLFFFIIVSSLAFAQGDDCSDAFDLGTLPVPNSCFGANPPSYGVGASIVENGSSIGSTAANPYVYMIDCGTGTTDMADGAVDVWYSFVASGTELEVNLSGSLVNPNIGLWSGNCINLTGRGCAIGDASGDLTESFGPLIVGETYLIQISGNGPFIQGTFVLELNNNLDCNGCLEVGVLTANPPPINGSYSAGQDVEFCFTITDYNQSSSNWLHGVQVEWSSGWETTVNDVVATAPNSCSGAGDWNWYPAGTTGSNSGTVLPSGFYYESNGGCSPLPCDPNNPGDNYGDSNAESCDPEFCWTLTTLPPISCTASIPLTVSVNTTADSESGSFTNLACQSDLSTEYSSMLSCCALPPTVSSVDLSCGSSTPDGSATVQAVGFALPWTYQWYDDTGTLISTSSFSSSNINTISNLFAGSYTVVVTDNTGCSSGNVVTVTSPVPSPATFPPLPFICQGETLILPTTSQEGFSGTWSPAVNNMATTNYTFTPDPGQCGLPGNAVVVVRPAPMILPINDITICGSPTTGISAVLPCCGITSVLWSAPQGTFSSTTSLTTTFTPGIASGSILVSATASSNICTITTLETLLVNVSSGTTSIFTPIADICPGDLFTLPPTSDNGITGTWSPAVNNTASTNYTFTPDAGQCATTETMTVTVNAQTTPSFTAIADICSGSSLSLPGSSTNSISGTWSPAVNNTASTNYTFTPDAGQCATTETMTVNVNAQTTPSFTAIADICSGSSLSLPGSSTNSISGTWSPAVNNTASTNYTFTPDAGQCATTETMTVNVNAQTTPSFTAIADICSGSSLSLPGSSTNSISGTWSPAVNNTASTNYTFTPDAGQCATTETMTVNVNAQTTPSFTAIADICSGSSLSLPGSSTNSISGTWSPAVNNTASTNYTFTPDAGQCATTETMTVTVNAQTTPSFTAIADICSGSSLSLPGSSTNSISGTWSPAVNNTASTNYTFTPDAGQCATTETMTVNVNAQTTPSFTAIADICSGSSLSLPGSSTNSISGTWSPAVNNTASTNYTFTPDAGQCATTETMTVTVNAQTTPSFTAIADICSGSSLSLPGSSTNSISGTWSPAVNNTASTNYTFTPDAGQCATTETMTVNVNAQTTPSFTAIADICSGSSLSLPGSSTNSISGTWSPAVNNTASTNYTFTPDAGQCATTETMTVNVNAQTTPSFTAIADICSGSSLSLPGSSTNSISGTWSPAVNNTASTNYTFTPDAGQCATTETMTVNVNAQTTPSFTAIADICSGSSLSLPGSSTNSISGTWSPAVNNTASTNYTFTPDAGQCATTETMTVNVNAQTTPSFTAIADICSGSSLSLPGSSTNSISGTWSPAVNNTASTNYTFTPDAGQCATTETMTVNVNAQTTPSFTAIADICSGSSLSLPGSSTNSISGTWSPAVNNTASTNYTFTPDAGQCATTETMTVNVNAQTTPSFTAIADICSGSSLSLPGSSTNSISGTWSPAVNNTASTNYTFTPDAGQCATTETMTVNVNAQTTPSFTAIADICSGSSLSLPGSSTNSISGTWSPAVNNTASTNYTFTPDAGQCATTETMTVNVNAQTTPSFTAIADICSGSSLSLPGSSTNSISGTWSPAVNNTASTNYTFTPDAGQCATTETMTVNVNAQTTPSFTAIADICSGSSLSLPGSSTNSISGTWSPAVNNTASTNYTFTPDAGQCATTETMTVNVNAQTTPSFTAIADICSGSSLSLPGSSTNSISGTWSPAVNNTASTNYTFTPDAGQCATTETMTVNVNAQTTPSFTAIADICSGSSLSLPGSSTNSISGTWSPAVNNTASTNYTFTPDAGQCATTETMTVNVNAQTTPSFTAIADICSGSSLSLPGSSTNSISGTWSPAVNNTASTNYTFTPDAGQCATTETMTVNVNAQTTPSFTAIADICSGSSLSLPGSSTNSISGTWSPAVNNTASTNYTFTPDAGQCATTETMTVNVNDLPSFTSELGNDPLNCGGLDGSILLSGLSASSSYDFTYNDGSSNVGPLSITTDASGSYILSSISAGSYSSFMITDGNCSYTVVPSVTLVDPSAPVFTANSVGDPSTCLGDDGVIDLTGLLSNTTYALTYLDDGVSVGPINVTSDGSGNIALNSLDAGTYTSFVMNLAGCTGSTGSSISLTDPTSPVLQLTDPSAVCSPLTVDLSAPDLTTGSTGGGALTYWTDAAATVSLVDPTALSTSGMYYIQSQSNGCTDIASVNVTINETPILLLTDPSAVCSPLTVDLSAPDLTTGSTGGGTLTYWTDAAATVSLVDPTALSTSGMYYIQSQSNGCTDIASVNVTINETPVLLLTDPSAVCSPLTVDLSAPDLTTGSTGGGTLTYWTDAAATVSLVDPTALSTSGMYYIQSQSNGCTDIASVNVTINETPVLLLTDPSAVCSPLTVDLSDPDLTTGSTGGGTLTYWTDAAATVSLVDPTALSTSGMYYIQSQSNGCTDIASVNVTINDLPSFTSELGNDPLNCGGLDGSILLSGLSASSSYDFTYNDGSSNVGPLSITTDASGSYILSSISAGSYSSFMITDGNCSYTVVPSVTLVDPSAPVFTANSVGDPSTCLGDDGVIDLTGLLSNTTYALTYLDDGVSVGPINVTSDGSGNIALNSLDAGTYTSFVMNLAGCTGSTGSSISLTDPTSPVLQLTDPSAVCSPLTVDLSAPDLTTGSTGGGALTYWTDAAATVSLVDPTALSTSGMYYIQSQSNGCTDIASVNVTINETPILLLTDPSAVCSPLTVDLSAPDLTTGSTGGGTLTYWTDAAATVSLVDPTALSTSGMYYIQSQSNGCTDIASVNVTINETPVLLLTDPSAVCSPLTVDLSAPDLTTGSTGGGTLTYWTDAAATVSLVDPTALSTSGMYYIQSQSNGCTDIASVNVTINETPVLLLTDPSAVCSPLTVDLSAPDLTTGSTGGGTLTYWTDAAATVSLVDPTALSTSGMYYIQSQSNGCTDIASVNVTVNPTPSFSVYGTDPTVCNASDGVITISGLEPLTNYILAYDSLATVSQVATITTDATGGFTINGFQAGLYEAFSIALNGCEFTATENIDLNNPLAPSVDVQVDNTVCDSYTLEGITGNNLSGNEAYYSQSNGAGETWSPGDVITASQTVYIYDVIGACSDETSFSLTVNITPVITNLSAQQACESYMLPVNINGADLSGSQNYYNDTQENGGTAITNPITSSQTVYMFDANGLCRDEVSFEVSIYDLPQVLSFSGEGTYCEGEVVGNLTAEVSGVGTYTIDYTLDGNLSIANTAATAVDLGNEAGVYVLTAISDDHCNNNVDLTQTITINALPDAPVVSEDAQYCSNEQAVPMEAQGSSGTYTWYSDNNLTNVLTIQESYTPSNTIGSTNYYVTATENGCQGPAQMITIDFLECGITIPTAFTPDGDNVNDFWKINDLDAIYPNNVVHVYNRLGNQIYESMEGGYNQMPWDGRFENQDLPVASYYYIIEYNDNTTQNSNGIITIVK